MSVRFRKKANASRALKKSVFIPITLSLFMMACGRGDPSYSILSDSETFNQKSATVVNNKIDVLWVVDNSGSMATSQQQLSDNFETFIELFVSKEYDFKVAVTTSDAFLGKDDQADFVTFYGNYPQFFESLPQAQKSKFRDHSPSGTSGYPVITPDLLLPINGETATQAFDRFSNLFSINILQGTSGYGDERPLQSMKAALNSSLNTGFVREDSFLSVIMVTDEDDFSHDSIDSSPHVNRNYNFANLHTVSSYVDYLDGITESNTGRSVSSIAIQDEACKTTLTQDGWNERIIAQRVNELVDATGGTKGSLCDDFSVVLESIATAVGESSIVYFLSKPPVPETIRVFVNQVEIPEQSPATNGLGWGYKAEDNSITFKGKDYLPAQGAEINVTFDPVFIEF